MVSLNHIGIAVAQIPEMKKLFALLGMRSTHTEPVPEQGVIAHFLPLQFEASGAALEFLEPIDPKGTVASFIAKRGAGIHHLSFTTGKGELNSLCARLRSEGFRLVYEAPRAGAHQM